MAVKGVFASDQNIQGTRKGDFASALLQTMPTGSAPLLALTSGMESQDAVDTVITWFEENHLTGRIGITNNAASGLSFTLEDASSVIAGQVYMIEASGEYVYIDSVAGSIATVTRNFAGTTTVAINGSVTVAYMQKIGTAYEEGSSKPTAFANLGFPLFNYMQIFRNAWDVTGTARAVQYLTGDIVAKNKRDASIFHSEDMERSILWGRKAIGTLNGKPFRTMDGVVTQIKARGNSTAEGANTTWTNIDAFLRTVFSTNIKGKPNERIVFADNQVVGVLNSIAKLEGTHDLKPGQTDFGMKINKWFTPYGDVTVMTHPLINEAQAFRGDMYILHPGAMKTRYLRRTMEDRNDSTGQRAGVDADYGVFTTEMSVEYKGALTGGVYENISIAA